jgi:peptidoglycan/xylan/chitin deacetylase (PgdA/CDA1 family)
MRIPGKKTAVQINRWLSSRLSHRGIILGYHRVASPTSDEYEICVSASFFAEQMQVIRQKYRPVSLMDMAAGLLSGMLPHKSVAVTFDDGYADNLYAAKPLLERFEIPATVFVSPGSLGHEFWWDKLEQLILSPPELPDSLHLSLGEGRLEWNGGERRQLLKLLYNRLLLLDDTPREDILQSIQTWTGHSYEDRLAYRALQPDELAELARDGLVDIGAHTMTHPILSRLPAAQQRDEIQCSKIRLEEILGRSVTGFAYPNGFFGEDTVSIVKDMKFDYACSSKRDVVWRKQDRYHLPRFWSHNWNGDRFARDLQLWLG